MRVGSLKPPSGAACGLRYLLEHFGCNVVDGFRDVGLCYDAAATPGLVHHRNTSNLVLLH